MIDWTPILSGVIGAVAGLGGAAVSGHFNLRTAKTENTARATEIQRDRELQQADRIDADRRSAYRALIAAGHELTDLLYEFIWRPPPSKDDESEARTRLIETLERLRSDVRAAVIEVRLVGSDQVVAVANQLSELVLTLELNLATELTKYSAGDSEEKSIVGAFKKAVEATDEPKNMGSLVAGLEIAVRKDLGTR